MPETAQIERISFPGETTITRTAPPRDLYIDRLRTIMTAFVILHHTAITYGGAGS